MSIENRVQEHYDREGLAETILEALSAAGKDLDRLRPEDLAAVDEFHVRGREATKELARKTEIGSATRVLDVGSGVGGPSRHLAAEFGAHVMGLDLSEEYCRAATVLAERTGLAERVTYRQGNALAMPFEDETFDVVWSQHAAMNIPDKPRLYSEMWRVLRPGGTVAIYDILAGPGGDVFFPVPWAREPETSFLMEPEGFRQVLEATGFEIIHWQDTTGVGRDWFSARLSAAQRGGPPPLGLQVLLGPEFPVMAINLVRNLQENRVALIEMVGRRPE